jgi:uncharacterized repeat protein (TIGR02543 family)
MNKNMNKKRLALATAFIILVVLFLPMVTSYSYHQSNQPPPKDRDWWDISWPFRKLITIDYTKVGGNLANFPVLISLASDSDLAAHAQSDGDDIVFTDYNNNQLNHEIEKYTSATGSLIAWVNVTSLSSTTNTYLYLYYGNPTTGNNEHIADVWNGNFKIVQHLKETTGLHYDSTQYDNDGTATVTVQGSAVGEIDGCDEFNGAANKIDCGNKVSLNMTSAITVEAWVYNHAGTTVAYPRITDKFPAPAIYIRETDDLVGWYGNIGGVACDFTFPTTTVPHNTWSYVVVTYINNATHPAKAYLNGQLKNTTKTYSGALTATTNKLYIGNRAALDRGFDGKLDEIRISNSVRNASWVKTCYNNQNSPSTFFSLGSEDAYQYTLSITINGQGSVTKDPDQSGYTYGTVVTLTADPDDGWTFDHWSGDLTGSENPTTITMNGNKDVSAYFTQNEYTLTITIDPVEGGTVDTDIAPPYHYNDIVTVTANANPGYTFDHWSGDLTGSTNPTTITMNGNKAVTAHFTQNQYTLTITYEGQGLVEKTPDQPTYTYGEEVTLTAFPDPGWSFDHWSGDLTGSNNPEVITIDGDETVIAHFTQDQYTLTITIDGQGTVVKNPDYPTYTYGTTVDLAALPSTGWIFDHWSGDLSGNENPTSIIMNGNNAITAHFTITSGYVLTISTEGQGTVTKDPDKPSYTYGEIVTLTAYPTTGWIFNHWEENLTGSQNPTTIAMTGNKYVIANFTITSGYTLTITIEGEGSVTKDPDQASYTYGQVVNLTAVPETGWVFDHWAGDLSGDENPTSITMNGSKSVTANFTLSLGYILTITIEGQGTVTKNPDQSSYSYGQVITLTAIPAAGWHFSHWGGDLSGSQNPITIIMNGNKSVIANFTATHYTLTITIEGQGTITKNPNKPWYIYGTVVTLTAINSTHWFFTRWEGSLTGSKNPTTITIDGNKTVIANFTFKNRTPLVPDKPQGETRGRIKVEYTYTAVTSDQDNDQIYYQFNWSDGTATTWLGPYNSGEKVSTNHTYIIKGNYAIQVRAKDTFGAISDWSDPLPVVMPKSKSLIPRFFILQLLDQLFEHFPHLFPFLRYLLGY